MSSSSHLRLSGILLILVPAMFLSFAGRAGAETLRIALLTDVHLAEGSHSVDDLEMCIRDINASAFDFVLVSGDLTDFGSDRELALARKMLDSLHPEYYVVPGNHDAKWSESGSNSFAKVFGYEHFSFTKAGWHFFGCPCGPDVRMAPGLVSRESLMWMDSLPETGRSIFVNHYPIDSSLLNYGDVLQRMAAHDVRLVIGGHWHGNTSMEYGGCPGFLGRSSLSGRSTASGYSIIELDGDRVSVRERRVYSDSTSVTLPCWYSRELHKVDYGDVAGRLPSDYPWMDYGVNEKYADVKELWRLNDGGNVAAGFATGYKDRAFYGSTTGCFRAVSIKDGSTVWQTGLPGKIYSTPVVAGKIVYVGCADGCLYALSASKGRILWKYEAGRSVLASPVVRDGKVFFGASDGVFRALDASDGSLLWEFKDVDGFVEDRPLVDAVQVVFGSWGGKLYSLSPHDGSLQWVWTTPRKSRMYSPAACWPVKSAGRIFIAVPDRRVYAIDASTGVELYHVEGGREALGMSSDGSTIYVKTMHHQAYAFRANMTAAGLMGGTVPDSELLWRKDTCLGYDIAPTSLIEYKGVLLIPTDKGNIVALSASTGDFLWAHKISTGLVNPLTLCPASSGKMKSVSSGQDGCRILASTMDGAVVCLKIGG